MARYIIKRLLIMVVIVWCAAIVVFTLMYLAPGDPARILLGSEADDNVIQMKRVALGIDKPYLMQLGIFMYKTFVKFDFGTSWVYNVPVMSELAERLPRTILIGFSAMILNVAIGVFLGIKAAIHEGKWQDSTIMIIAMAFISAPDFWVALMLIILFAQKLGWLPAYGIESWKSYVLPIICSCFGGIAVNARQSRSAMLEVIRADYITTARAKGQKEDVIVRKHMLPNALMPVITSLGNGLTSIVAGSPIIETVFVIPGVGAYLLTGLNSRDLPVVRSCVVFLAIFSSIAMLLTDLAYAFLDPRIKAQYASGRRTR
ncbi:MAG: ABC transporter permease [Lachnospiraceae bacterium]|jgi:ABC-type dipeptide/oligopeptide/nickel transport system permease component|nr:ABC transporter permease [Lachnospiraceae bacterium]